MNKSKRGKKIPSVFIAWDAMFDRVSFEGRNIPDCFVSREESIKPMEREIM